MSLSGKDNVLHLLVDNGSIRADSVLALRRIAAELSRLSGQQVLPASLNHSHKVCPVEIDDEPAFLLEDQLRLAARRGVRRVRIVPFLLAKSGSIASLVEAAVAELRGSGNLPIEISYTDYPFEPMSPADLTLANLLARLVRETIADQNLQKPPVVLVDHGSPRAQAAYVRNYIAGQLSAVLGQEVSLVVAASMERRPGKAYDFNDPLLEDVLTSPHFRGKKVVCALLFLLPGRHAGEGGDIAEICNSAAGKHPGTRVFRTSPFGSEAEFLQLMARRITA